MTTESNTPLLAALADVLVDKQVDTEKIRKYLGRVCDTFCFDCGFIYEIDQRNYLNLKEYHIAENSQFHKNFCIDEIDPEVQAYLSDNPVLTINKHDIHTIHGLRLLNFFFAASMVMASILDENEHIYGIILFLNTNEENDMLSTKKRELTVIVNILEKYIDTRMYQNKLSFAQNSLESVLDNTGIDIYVNDFNNHDILYVNKTMAAPYGGKATFMGKKCWEVLFPGQNGPCQFCPQHKLIDEHGDPTKVYSWNYQRPFDGSWFRVFSAAFRWVDGRLAHVISSADITENKRNEALIHYMANYDALTDLPNRRMLVSECERRINHAETGEKGYLLFFDIDGFKAINDNFGHDAGDEFLIQLGKFFSSIPMLHNAIYRNGGDEFVALLGDEITETNIRNLSHFIHERFTQPWVLKNGSIFCNTSIGVASYPEDGKTAEVLVNKADQAMYYTKKTGGGGISFYSEIASGE